MANDGATFYFDTNIEETVNRVVSGLSDVVAATAKTHGGSVSSPLQGLDKAVGKEIQAAKRKVGELNELFKTGGIDKGTLSRKYQDIVGELSAAVGKLGKKKNIDFDVIFDYNRGVIRRFAEVIKNEVESALKSTDLDKALKGRLGSGRIEARREDVREGFGPSADADNRATVSASKKRRQSVEKSAAAAEVTAAADTEAASAATQTTRERKRQLVAARRAADKAVKAAEAPAPETKSAPAPAPPPRTRPAKESNRERLIREKEDNLRVGEQIAAERRAAHPPTSAVITREDLFTRLSPTTLHRFASGLNATDRGYPINSDVGEHPRLAKLLGYFGPTRGGRNSPLPDGVEPNSFNPIDVTHLKGVEQPKSRVDARGIEQINRADQRRIGDRIKGELAAIERELEEQERATGVAAHAAADIAAASQQARDAAQASARQSKRKAFADKRAADAAESAAPAAGAGGGGGGNKRPPRNGPGDFDDEFAGRIGDLGGNDSTNGHSALFEKASKAQLKRAHAGLTEGVTREGDFTGGVARIGNSRFVADLRKEVTEIYLQVDHGFLKLKQGTTLFEQQMGRIGEQMQAEVNRLKREANSTARSVQAFGNLRNKALREDRARTNLADLRNGATDPGGFGDGIETIGGPAARYVADTRGLQTRIFRQVKDGFEEIAKGTAEFDAQIRRLRAQQEAHTRPGIFGSFGQGFAQGGLFGQGSKTGGISGALEGISRSAGLSAKYAVIGAALYNIQNAAAAAGAEILDFADSYTELNIALEGAGIAGADQDLKVTQQTINSLADSATLAGSNVGEAMDLAASAIRAFGGDTGQTQEDVERLGRTFAAEASKIATLTKTDIKDAAGNLKAAGLAFDVPVENLSRVTDAIVGAKQVGGGDEKQLSQAGASAAVAAKEAGFSIEQTYALLSRIVAETDEGGQLAASRFSKITAIIGGSAGKSAITRLNDSLADSQKIDISADVKTQVQQLASVYQTLDKAQQQQLINSLGGTANARELIILLSSANELIAKADQGFSGKGAEEYEKRLADIRAQLTKIQGELKQITVALSQSGVLDPFLALVKYGLLPALDATRKLLQFFNLIPRPIRDAAFAIAEIAIALKLIQAITRAGGLSNFFRGVEGAVAPVRTEARAAGAARKAGAAARAADAFDNVAIVGGASIKDTAGLRKRDRKRLRKERLAELFPDESIAPPQRRRSITGIDSRDVFAPVRAATGKFNAAYTKAVYDFSDATASNRARAIRDLRATPAPSKSFAKNQRIADILDGSGRATSVGDRLAVAKTNVQSSLGDISGKLKGIGSSIGPELGIAGVALSVSAALDATHKINDAIKEFDKLSSLRPESFGVDELRASAANLEAGAHSLNEASSGFFGTVVNFARGNETGARAKALKQQATFERAQADTIEKQTKNDRVGAGAALASTVDLSSADSLSASIEGLAGSGRSATTQLQALLSAMDNMAAGAGGAAVALTALDKTKIAANTGDRVFNSLTNLGQDSLFKNSAAARMNGKDLFGGLIKGADIGAAQDTVNTLGTLGLNRYFQRQDNGVGRFFRKSSLFGGGSKDAEDNFQLGKIDKTKVAQGVTDVTQTFLNQGGDISSDQGAADLKSLYITKLTQLLPKIPPGKIQQIAADAVAQAKAALRQLKSISDPSATLQEVLKQGKQLATDAGSEASTQAALGRNDPRGLGASLVQANTYLQGLRDQRKRAVELGAKPEELEAIDKDIAAGQVQQRQAAAGRQQQRDALALSRTPQGAKTSKALSQVERDLEKAGYDPKTGKRKRKTVKVLSPHISYDDITGKQEIVHTDDGATKQVDIGKGLEAGELDAKLAQAEDLRRQREQEKVANRISLRRSGIDPRDELKNAEADVKDAKDQVNLLKRQGEKGAALTDAKLAVTKAEQAQAKVAIESSIAARNVNAIPSSTYDTAKRNLDDARSRLSTMKKGTIEYNQQLAVINQAQGDLAAEMDNIKSINRQLRIDLTDPVAVANEQVTTAREALDRARTQTKDANGKTIDPQTRAQLVGTARLNLRSAEASAEAAAFQQFLSNAQTADQLGRISHKQYLSMLRNRADQLTAELAGMKKSDPMYKQITDQRDQLLGAIKAGADELSGVFNIGDIKVPTPYEVRKAIKEKDFGTILGSNAATSTAGNVTTDNSTRNLTLNGVPIEEVLTMIQDLFGAKARSRAGRKY